MNKSIKIGIIVIISIVVISVACLIISNINKSNSEKEYLAEEEQTQTQTQSQEALFWINAVNFAPKNENLNDNEFGISFPFKLEDLDNFNLSCGWKARPPLAPTITEYINSNEVLKWNEKQVFGHDYKTSVVVEAKGEYNYNTNYNPFDKAEFKIYNLSNSNSTINECYKKNWWTIQQHWNLHIAFDIEDPNDIYDPSSNTEPLLNAIAKKMGQPTYILCKPASSVIDNIDEEAKKLEENKGGFFYYIVYEYNDYVILFSTLESYSEYSVGNKIISEVYMVYCPKAFWEHSKIAEDEYLKTIDKNGVPLHFVSESPKHLF